MSIDINDIGKMDFSDISDGQEAPIHPGEILKEDYLIPLKMTANALALAIRVSPSRLSAIINGKRSITPETALRLAQYFGEQIRLEVLPPKVKGQDQLLPE